MEKKRILELPHMESVSWPKLTDFVIFCFLQRSPMVALRVLLSYDRDTELKSICCRLFSWNGCACSHALCSAPSPVHSSRCPDSRCPQLLMPLGSFLFILSYLPSPEECALFSQLSVADMFIFHVSGLSRRWSVSIWSTCEAWWLCRHLPLLNSQAPHTCPGYSDVLSTDGHWVS